MPLRRITTELQDAISRGLIPKTPVYRSDPEAFTHFQKVVKENLDLVEALLKLNPTLPETLQHYLVRAKTEAQLVLQGAAGSNASATSKDMMAVKCVVFYYTYKTSSHTLGWLGQHVGLSPERVRQIINKGDRLLKQPDSRFLTMPTPWGESDV